MSMNCKFAVRVVSGFVLAAGLSACGGVPDGGEFDRIADTPIGERSRDINRSAREAVNFFSEPPVTRLDIGASNRLRLTTDAGQEVPQVPVGEINAAPMEFGALLNQVAGQSGMSWRITGPGKDMLLSRQVYMVQRSETMLEKILDELSELTGAFYRVEGDRIVFSQDRLFVLRVPRMADSQKVLADGLGNLGASEVFTDTLSGTVSFRADRPTYKAARRLMRSFEQGRDMVVYDVWIIDRQIDDALGAGADIGLTGPNEGDDGKVDLAGADIVETIASGGPGSGFLSGNLGEVGVELTVNFLRSLGKTETVARPTISMLSGDESEFKSGETREYIREIRVPDSGDDDDDDDDDDDTGTDTEKLETGLNLTVSGSHHNGVISTQFDIEVDEFIGFEEFDSGDATLKLPRTTERSLNAHLEARPGDVMVLGGIIRNREDITGREIAGSGVPVARGREATKTETILLVRPRLVQIRPAEGASQADVLRVDAGVGSLDLEENPMSAVIEEEARARRMLGRIGN